MADADIGPVSRAAATEAWSVARARGIAITVEDPVAHVRAFGSKIPNAKPSLLLDYEAGRRGEIDVINCAIPRAAAPAAGEPPVNAPLTRPVPLRGSEHRRSGAAGGLQFSTPWSPCPSKKTTKSERQHPPT